jgi:uncharacterized Zn-finger protein
VSQSLFFDFIQIPINSFLSLLSFLLKTMEYYQFEPLYYCQQSTNNILDTEDVLYPTSAFSSPPVDGGLTAPNSICIPHIEPQDYPIYTPPPVNLEHRSSISSILSSCFSESRLLHCEFKGCSKTFRRSYNLKSHRRKHTDEKPFVCPLCTKAFARQHDRNRHEKLHSGIKPYPCHFCTKSFARQDALNRHLKRDRKKTRSLDNMNPPPCLMLKFRKRQLAKKKLNKL